MGERRLLELKARRSDLTAEGAWCAEHADPVAEVRQVDTYFRVRRGRLKMREVEGEEGGTLIYYRREETEEPKRSRVSLLRLSYPPNLFQVLREALGILVEVRKERRIYRWGRVQIHLDQVDGLGPFVEFERAVEGPEEEVRAREEFAALRAALSIEVEDLVAGSYSDLLSPP